jgi:hypothetical protein
MYFSPLRSDITIAHMAVESEDMVSVYTSCNLELYRDYWSTEVPPSETSR